MQISYVFATGVAVGAIIAGVTSIIYYESIIIAKRKWVKK